MSTRFFSSGFKLVIILCLSGPIYSQNKEVVGKIINQNAKALQGVNILLKGTPIGTVSNSNGEFNLILKSDSILILVALVGYKQLEVPVLFEHNVYFLEITMISTKRRFRNMESSVLITPLIKEQ